MRKIKISKDGNVEIQHFAIGGPVQNTSAIGGGGAPGQAQSTVVSGGNVFQGLGSMLTAQNGYQAQLAPTDYTNYQNTINSAGNNALSGFGASQNLQGQEQQLVNQYAQQAAGQGPNVAQNQLNQSTGQNVNAQAALMAGQRGAGANAGLMARQAAQQGANIQQTAVGQAATLGAEQQLAAQNAQSSLLNNMSTQNVAEQNSNNQLFTAGAGAQNTQNNTGVANYGMSQKINADASQNNANSVNSTMGGLMNGVGAAVSSLFNKGGEVEGKKTFKLLPKHLELMAKTYHPQNFAQGGTLQPDLKLLEGGKVAGKAKVEGNSPKNDTVPAMLSPGEIVIPRSVLQSDDPVQNAAKFVAEQLKKHQAKHASKESLNKAVAARGVK